MSGASLKQLFDLSGRVAIVTGGSRGLGLQIAEALGEQGAHIVLVARKLEALEDAAQHLRDLGYQASTLAADLSGPDAAEHVVTTVYRTLGRVDILVNNAGATWGAATENHPLEAWNKVISVNLTATFLLTQSVGKLVMIPARSGRILNVASIEGLRGHHHTMPATLAYNTTKGGIVNFTRALAAEWGQYGITINALAPGYFPSKMTEATLEQHEQQIIARTPLMKLGGPADLKGPALLLTSDAGGHITGQILVVDGGAMVT